MKNVLALALVVVTVLLCSSAQAGRFQDEQRHGSWKSCVYKPDGQMNLADVERKTAAYMYALAKDKQSSLHIDFLFGKCRIIGITSPFIKKESPEKYIYMHNNNLMLPGTIRVDTGRIYDVAFHIDRKNQGKEQTIYLHESFYNILIQEACRGSVIKIKVGWNTPTFTFSLRGFSDAMYRCASWGHRR